MLRGNDYVILPKDLAHRQMIALADVEEVGLVHDVCSAGEFDLEPAADGAKLVGLAEEHGYAGVGEHEGVFACLDGVDSRLGKHVVEHSADV